MQPIDGILNKLFTTHLLIVLKNYVTGKKSGSIPEGNIEILRNLDGVYQKLTALTEAEDDETPQPLTFTLPEAKR